MLKITVLYGQPTDPAAFDRYYFREHVPMAAKIPFTRKLEVTRFGPNPDGSEPPYYLMGTLYYANEEELQKAMQSAEGQAAVADLANFATGGVTFLNGFVEPTPELIKTEPLAGAH